MNNLPVVLIQRPPNERGTHTIMATTFIGSQFRPQLFTDTTRKPGPKPPQNQEAQEVRYPQPPMKTIKEMDEKNREKIFCEGPNCGDNATGTVRGTPPVVQKVMKDKDSSEKSAESTGSLSSSSDDVVRNLPRFLHSQG